MVHGGRLQIRRGGRRRASCSLARGREEGGGKLEGSEGKMTLSKGGAAAPLSRRSSRGWLGCGAEEAAASCFCQQPQQPKQQPKQPHNDSKAATRRSFTQAPSRVSRLPGQGKGWICYLLSGQRVGAVGKCNFWVGQERKKEKPKGAKRSLSFGFSSFAKWAEVAFDTPIFGSS